MRKKLADQYLKGHGIEIGGLHFPLPLPPGCTVTYVDRAPLEEVAKLHHDVAIVQNPIIVDDAQTLATFEDGQLDFLIANHVLEHCEDPIGALKNWARVLKPGGIIYAAVPEKTQTFDKRRAVTTLDHLIVDHANGSREGDLAHYKEYHRLVDNLPAHVADLHAEESFKNRVNIHFHVWDVSAQTELIGYCVGTLRLFELVQCGINGAEIVWILRRPA